MLGVMPIEIANESRMILAIFHRDIAPPPNATQPGGNVADGGGSAMILSAR